MAMEAETTVLRRPLSAYLAAGGGGGIGEEVSSGRQQAPPVFLARPPVDPVIWADEKRMKRELLVWAKAVASMVASNNTSCSSPASSWSSTRHSG
ncbi:hypothetical protein Zm00014a_015235 [Zea mays]|uniref:Uncharacterized protein n=1 Tax=Zea mays TaxID=4577 RepID=A0A3L6DDL2_MAIZE|nr:hypothetical protein Zm00014a_015235 [Zea mays]